MGGVASRAFPNLMGILGADILSRFGVVRLDYAAQTMTMETEGPPPTSSVRGSTATMSVPASFSRGTVQVVPMDVDVVHDELLVFLKLSAVRPDVQVSVGGQHREFVLDTGASLTVLSPMLTRSARLGPPIRTALFNAGLSCPVSASIYQLTSWSLGTLRLHPASVVSNQLPPGVDGLLGSGTLELYSPVVLDFLDGAILLSRLHAS